MIENQEDFIEYKTPEVKAIRASCPGKGHDEIFKDLIQTVGVYLTILSVNEKLPVSKFRYFGKNIIQLLGYCYVHDFGQRKAGLGR